MRIAHFSDVHALSLKGVKPWQFLSKRAAGYINLRSRRRDKHPVRLFEALIEDLNRRAPDEVVCTGDLTNLSLEPEFRLARDLFGRIARGPEHVTVVPGNHDVYTLDAMASGLFRSLFAPYAASDDSSTVDFPTTRVRGDVAIIGLSTARPSPPPFADGRLGRAQLESLEGRLMETHDKFRIVLLHHPPYSNRHAFLRGLRDREALQDVLRRVGCELVLHGHEHRNLRAELDGPDGKIPVIGVGSCTYDDPRPERVARYNVYHVEGKRLVGVEAYAFDASTGGFSSVPAVG